MRCDTGMPIHRTVIACTVLSTLMGCAPKAPPASAWTKAGDAALANDDPAALANYGAARDASTSRAGAGRQDSRGRAPVGARSTRFAIQRTGEARQVLARVGGFRAAAATRGLGAAFEPALAPIEESAAAALWSSESAAIKPEPDPFLRLARLGALRETLPPTAIRAGSSATADLEAERNALVSAQRSLVERATNPGARAVQTIVLEALEAAPRAPRRTFPPELAQSATVGFTIETSGCEALSDVRRGAALPGSGAHMVAIRIDGACSANEERGTAKKQGTRYREERTSVVETELRCRQVRETARICNARGPSGACLDSSETTVGSREECDQVPVTRQKTVSVPETFEYTVRERRLRARVQGTIAVTIDGAETKIPFDLPASLTEQEDAETKTTFSPRTPNGLVTALVGEDLATRLRGAADDARSRIGRARLLDAESRLAAGDTQGAEAQLATLLAAGALKTEDLSPAWSPLAQEAGLSFPRWVSVVVDGTMPEAPAEARIAPGPLHPPAPDEALSEREAHARDAASDDEHEEDMTEGQNGRWFDLGLAANHWQRLTDDGKGGVGLGADLALRGTSGGRLPFVFYDGHVGLQMNFGDMAFGLDGALRVGLGVRSRRLGLAPFVTAGCRGAGARKEVTSTSRWGSTPAAACARACASATPKGSSSTWSAHFVPSASRARPPRPSCSAFATSCGTSAALRATTRAACPARARSFRTAEAIGSFPRPECEAEAAQSPTSSPCDPRRSRRRNAPIS